MSGGPWEYPPELREALLAFGLQPTRTTPPRFTRDALSDLYRYEIRRLRDRLLAGQVAKADYQGLVVELRKKYWPLTLTPAAWEKITTTSGVVS
jgi:hypothetical protein